MFVRGRGRAGMRDRRREKEYEKFHFENQQVA